MHESERFLVIVPAEPDEVVLYRGNEMPPQPDQLPKLPGVRVYEQPESPNSTKLVTVKLLGDEVLVFRRREPGLLKLLGRQVPEPEYELIDSYPIERVQRLA